jgi:hypothetical protein
MKTWIILITALTGVPAFCHDLESAAFERLAYEVSKSNDASVRMDSISAYLDSMDRIGTMPSSTEACIHSSLEGTPGSSCKSLALMARGGGGTTGGTD